MTIKEAKQQLQKLIVDRGLILARKSDIVGDSVKEIYRKDIEALKKAVEVLEKQIPKKPIRRLYYEFRDCPFCYYEGGDCPFCETTVYISDDEFCPSCGQALDWSETDD